MNPQIEENVMNELDSSAETDKIEEQDMQFHKITFNFHGQRNQGLRNESKERPKENKYNPNLQESSNETVEAILSGLALSKLPDNFISCYINVKSLDLRDNFLTDFPKEILNLLSLRILRLDNNKMSSVPPQIGNLLQLKVLTLSRNYLQFLEPGISKLTSLMALAINDNRSEERRVGKECTS